MKIEVAKFFGRTPGVNNPIPGVGGTGIPAKGGGINAKDFGAMANDIDALTAAALHKGSIYTHDHFAQQYLKTIVSLLSRGGVGGSGGNGGLGGRRGVHDKGNPGKTSKETIFERERAAAAKRKAGPGATGGTHGHHGIPKAPRKGIRGKMRGVGGALAGIGAYLLPDVIGMGAGALMGEGAEDLAGTAINTTMGAADAVSDVRAVTSAVKGAGTLANAAKGAGAAGELATVAKGASTLGNVAKGAGTLGKVVKGLPWISLLLGGAAGAMGAESEGRGTLEGTLLGAVTGSAGTGSLLGMTGLVESGGAADEAAGIGMSALGGAGIGAAVGSVIPGLGTAVGAAVGGAIGGGAEIYKIMTKPDSPLRKKITDWGIGWWNVQKETAKWMAGAASKGLDYATKAGQTLATTLKDNSGTIINTLVPGAGILDATSKLFGGGSADVLSQGKGMFDSLFNWFRPKSTIAPNMDAHMQSQAETARASNVTKSLPDTKELETLNAHSEDSVNALNDIKDLLTAILRQNAMDAGMSLSTTPNTKSPIAPDYGRIVSNGRFGSVNRGLSLSTQSL